VAVGDDFIYRKPSIGTINVLAEKTGFNRLDGDYFYIGDACGRESDHSAFDYRLSENLGWGFMTPEMFFLNQLNNIPPQINLLGLQCQPMIIPEIPDNIKILFLQAPPASGKTTICQKFQQFYRINQDELKTINKCVKVAKEKLQQGHKIIIDRTNPNPESMQPFMDLNNQCGILQIKIDNWLNKHLNYFRSANNNTKPIPDIAYHIFHKKYKKPTVQDGFKWIGEVDWRMEREMEGFRRWYF